MRVLIVEDYRPIRESVARGLREAGFAVDSAENGREGLWLATTNDFDVIVLDLMLPEVDGLSILRQIRSSGRPARVILLTAQDQITDRVTGLNAGADDYLIKPFAFVELLARVKSLVRRKYETPNPSIRLGTLEIDTAARSVVREGETIELTAREFALLEYLAHRAGQVVSRTDIWEHVYDFNSDASSNVVDVYIGYLRKKIERNGQPKLIHTRRGQGYCLSEKSC